MRQCMIKLATTQQSMALDMSKRIKTQMKAFSQQQTSQIQRLTVEGNKIKAEYAEASSRHTKAYRLYEKRANEALDVLQRDTEIESNMFLKVWESNTKPECALDEVLRAEKKYRRSVEELNQKARVYHDKMKENLHAFQLTEEQRINFIKDLLKQCQKIQVDSIVTLEQLIQEWNTISIQFKDHPMLSQDLPTKPREIREIEDAYGRITTHIKQVQRYTDVAQQSIDSVLTYLVESIGAEESFTNGISKILRANEQNSQSSSSFLSMSSPNPCESEGETLLAGWTSIIHQLDLIANVHTEYGSLMAEPVLLNIETMKQEHLGVKNQLEVRMNHASQLFQSQMVARNRLEQKIEVKSRDVQAALVQSKKDGPQLKTDLERMRLEQIDQTEKVKRAYEIYYKETNEILDQLQQNEKYRIQVFHSSFQSLSQAHCHMVRGWLRIVHETTKSLEKIEAAKDIGEFVEPLAKSSELQTVSVIECDSPVLIEALRQHKPLSVILSPEKSSSGSKEDIMEEEQPVVDIQKRFTLPVTEQLVSSYACALYQGNFPCQGRLYLTQNYLCFTGWNDAYAVIPYVDVKSLEKKHSARVFPNAIEIETETDGKLFFGSFIYREDCFQTLMQLWKIRKQIGHLLSDAPNSPSTEDGIIKEYEVTADMTLNLSVKEIFEQHWKTAEAYREFLNESGETLIEISDWELNEEEYTAVCTPDRFQARRKVNYCHNKKYIIGPNSVPTRQIQRYIYNEKKQILVISMTSTISDAPYHDYFRVENRWLFVTPDQNKKSECRLIAGARVVFIKSTWLKKQIETNVVTESKESIVKWAKFSQKDRSKVVKPVIQPIAKAPAVVVRYDAYLLFVLVGLNFVTMLYMIYSVQQLNRTVEDLKHLIIRH